MSASTFFTNCDVQRRNKVIFTTAWLNIAANLLLAGVKIAIGAATNSIAIISEGVNNATDMASSVMTMVGTKLAQKRPTKKHPFGFGRIEYLTSLLIGMLILLAGIELLKNAVQQIAHPDELKVSYASLVALVVSLGVKLAIGIYTIACGRKVNSKALVAVGEDSRSDSIVSAITIAASLVFLLCHHSVDAWAGIITSLFVLKAAWDVLGDTIGALLGQPVDKELADELYALIRSTDGIVNAVDMTLHNYGPNAYTGSVNIEVDHKRTIGDVYAVIHSLQLKIMHKYNVTMVFGIYAVDNDAPHLSEIRGNIVNFIRGKSHVKSCHALYIAQDCNELYCDLIVDYELPDRDRLRDEFIGYMKNIYPQYDVILTVETEYV